MLPSLRHIPLLLVGVVLTLVPASCGADVAPEPARAGAEPPPGAPAATAKGERPKRGGPTSSRHSGAPGRRGSAPRDHRAGTSRHRIVRVRGRRPSPYASTPGGRLSRRLKARTRFGTRRGLSVVRERDGWMGVAVEERPNRRLAWLRAASPRIELATTRLSLHADLSRRRLELRRGDRVLSAMRVGVGRRENRTPTGRFAVTDRLSGRDYPDAYGCCILALTGHQTRVPSGWKGGDRLAIHGTNAPHSLGRASSSGCMRAPEAPLRRLMRTVPVGAPVFVRR